MKRAQFVAKNGSTAIKQTTEGTITRRMNVLPTAREAVQQAIAKGRL